MEGGGVFWNKLPTFDPESKFATSPKFSIVRWGGGSRTNFHLLILSLNLLKSKVL